MKRLGFITDIVGGKNAVRSALEILARTPDYRLETIEDFSNIDSVAQATWGLINLSDIVVAFVERESPNVYYEIGLAHGAGKPVVIVADTSISLPPGLIGQRVVIVDSRKPEIENLSFRLREAFKEIEKRGRSATGYGGPRDEATQYPPSHQPEAIPDFRSVFAAVGSARAIRFERWFGAIASAVPGWEVIVPERRISGEDAFDIVIWNSREDTELSALGNPIAVEFKAIRTMNSDRWKAFLHRTRVSGLRAIVLATTGTNDQSSKATLQRLRDEEGINAIVLDREDLLQVSDANDLLRLFKEKIRDFLYSEVR